MKILRVSLKNLNSLRGEYQIDLENGPLSQAGIFVITGPTGAGKSTILDAITLALYGRAARYGAEVPEDMMSRHTGECRAEVEFAVQTGRFRASWHLNRARGKIDGKMQNAQRRVFDAQGVTLAQNKTQADTEIERLTGLNYERFLRSVLLAQGEFARFLKANADERADLLEQLTGTEIYTDLSVRAYAETTRRENDLNLEERALAEIALLGEEERAERAAAIARLGVELAAGTLVHDTSAGRVALGRRLQAKREDLRSILAREAAFTERRKGAETDFQKLIRHRQAQPFCADLARLEAATVRADQEQRLLAEAEHAARTATRTLASARVAARTLSDAEAAAREQEAIRCRSEEAAAASQLAALRQWLESHASERVLDTALPAISAQLALLAEVRRQQGEWRTTGETLAARATALRAQLAEGQAKLGEAAAELSQRNAAKEKLAGELSVLLDGRALGDFQDDLRREHGRKALLTRLGVLQQKCVDVAAGDELLEKKEEMLAAELPLHREQAERSRSEAAMQGKLVEALQGHFTSATLIASFDDHRARLTPGEPCPLCGSADHPFAGPLSGQPSSLDSVGAKLELARKDQQDAEARRREKEQTLTRVSEQHRTLLERRAALRQELALARENFTAQAREHGISVVEPAGLQAEIGEAAEAIARIEKRINAIQMIGQAHEDAIRFFDDLRVRVGQREEASRAATGALVQAGGEIAVHAAARAKQDAVSAERISEAARLLEPFDEPVPAMGKETALRGSLENRRDRFAREAKSAESLVATLQQTRHRSSEADGAWQRARQQAKAFPLPDPSQGHDETLAVHFASEWRTVEVCRERVGELISAAAGSVSAEQARGSNCLAAKTLVDEITLILNTRLAETSGGFTGLEDLRAARLADETADRFEKTAHGMENEENLLRGQRRQIESEIASLCAQAAPEEDGIAVLILEVTQHKAANEALVAQRTRVEEEIRRDDGNRAAQAQRGEVIKKALSELKYWRWLNELVGSFDGRKFRRFAQGLSLDVLVRHANRHLARLSDRYRLLRVEGEELELEIADYYQAGTTRRMASLSGGESFLTSLALALGLSDLAGRNVRIDSLFVDEGFGSLDAVTLDIAVAALESLLRTSNKTIGIISHVELLKERITAQIRLEKLPGGISTITITG